MNILFVRNLIGSEYGVGRERGRLVYDAVLPLLQAGQHVVLDFTDVHVFTGGFLTTALGLYYEHFTREDLQTRLTVVNLSDAGHRTARLVLETAREYYGVESN